MAEKKIDAVFEGGGVKGIGLVGAVVVTEEQGYRFENVAGTSAGAIVGSLVAAGYNGAELRTIMQQLDYRNFQDEGALDRVPLVGKLLSVIFERGIYEGDFLTEWLSALLEHAPRGPVRTFKDLVMPEHADDDRYRYKLQVVASDLTRGRLLVLPRDARDYGVEPDDLPVVAAVRMSMSIPFFYEPVMLKDRDGSRCCIVDGGLLSNYPVWLFDDDTPDPPWPTFGYKLVEPDEGKPRSIRGPITLLTAMFSTMMGAHDARYIEDSNFSRTIPIPTRGVGTTEFDLSKERSEMLYQSGVEAARDFFKRWDFEKYKVKYRYSKPAQRRDRV